jgi:hypothetical protein
MNTWVLLQPGDQLPKLNEDQFILLAMTKGGILRVMFRFAKNIRGNIAGYLIHDKNTLAAHDWHTLNGVTKATALDQRYLKTNLKLSDHTKAHRLQAGRSNQLYLSH